MWIGQEHPFMDVSLLKMWWSWCIQKMSHVLGAGVLVSRVVEEDFSFPLKGLPLCAGGASFTSPPYRITPKTIYYLHDPTAVSVLPAGDDQNIGNMIVQSWESLNHLHHNERYRVLN